MYGTLSTHIESYEYGSSGFPCQCVNCSFTLMICGYRYGIRKESPEFVKKQPKKSGIRRKSPESVCPPLYILYIIMERM